MDMAVLWLLLMTMVGGAYLWSFTTDVARPEAVSPTSDLPPLALFVHPLTGLTGLSVWIVFMKTDDALWAWVAFVVLLLGALLGDLLLVRTLRRTSEHRAEDRMPRPAIAVHGTFAVATLAMALAAAVRA